MNQEPNIRPHAKSEGESLPATLPVTAPPAAVPLQSSGQMSDTMPDPLSMPYNQFHQPIETPLQPNTAFITASTVPLPPSGRKPHKALIISGIALLLVLVGLAGGAWYYYDTYPLKADYVAAQDKLNGLVLNPKHTKQFEDIANKKDISDLPDEELQTYAVNFRKVRDDVVKTFDEFDSLRVNKDEDVRSAYEELSKRYSMTSLEYLTLVESYPQVRKMGTACAAVDIGNPVEEARTGDEALALYTRRVQPCLDGVAPLKQSQNKTIANFATSYENVINDLGQKLKEARDATTTAQVLRILADIRKIEGRTVSMRNGMQDDIDYMKKEVERIDTLADKLKKALKAGKAKALI